MRVENLEESLKETERHPLDRQIDLSRVNWEVAAFGLLLLVTLAMRLYDLGPRPLHHDEAQHAFFSWDLFRGGGYKYNPMLHGPFLYYLTALTYFLFGVGDDVARLGPAIFGVLLVGGCFLLRPHIGRVGALAAAVTLAFSPVSLYYSRFIRHDIFAGTATLGMAIAILGFIRTRKPAYLYLGAVSLAISWTSHELTFITLFIFGSFLLLVALAGGREQNLLLGALGSLRRSPQLILASLLLFGAVITVLFTNFLTHPPGLLDGLTKSLTYWLGQHGVARGGQPWFYYLILLAVYEPLGVILGLFGGVYLFLGGKRIAGRADWFGENADRRWMRSFTLFFLIYWFVMAVAIYSWAGEKMPWLALHMVIPLALLVGVSLDALICSVNWRTVRLQDGLLLATFAVLLLAAIAGTVTVFFGGPDAAAPGRGLPIQGILLAIIAIVLLAGVALYWGRLGGRTSKRVLSLAGIALLSVYMVHSAWNVSYYNGANPVELLVYVQTTPATKSISDRLHTLSRDATTFDRSSSDVTGGRSLKILIDRSVEWPFDWYLRDLRNHSYFSVESLPERIDADVVLVAAMHDQALKPLLQDDYAGRKYPLRWWFPEQNYKTMSLETAVANLTNPESLAKLGRYYLYRDISEPLGSFDFVVYVKKDLAPRLGIPDGSQEVQESHAGQG